MTEERKHAILLARDLASGQTALQSGNPAIRSLRVS